MVVGATPSQAIAHHFQRPATRSRGRRQRRNGSAGDDRAADNKQTSQPMTKR